MALEFINEITVYNYNYKYRYNNPKGKTIGILAQEMKVLDDKYKQTITGEFDEEYSKLISNDEYTDLISIKPDRIKFYLISCIKELTKKNKSLEDELVSTKLKMAELQEQIDDKTNYALNERLTILEKQIAEIDI